MSARDVASAAVSAVLTDAEPVRLAELPEAQAEYLRRLGALPAA